jgi:hypothetical protein
MEYKMPVVKKTEKVTSNLPSNITVLKTFNPIISKDEKI